MGKLTVECSLCKCLYNSEKEYNAHECCADNFKVPFEIKQEVCDEPYADNIESIEIPVDVKIKEEPIDEDSELAVAIDPLEEASAELSDGEDKDDCEDEGLCLSDDGGKDPDYIPFGGKEEPPTVIEGNEDKFIQTVDCSKDKQPNRNIDMCLKNNECYICGKKFYRKADGIFHIENYHKTPRPFRCTICFKRFTQKHYAKLHLRVHTGERPYKCHLCPKAYTHKTSYTIHMRIHSGVRPYVCGVCGKKCYDKSGLTSHMRSHTKETPYMCEICGREFTHSKSLLVHRRNHTGERPYECKYCQKTFRHWHKHKIHIRLHTGERPYKCKICGKGFPRNDEVKRHMKSHTGIKSFRCSVCGIYCATQASIAGHINLHHSNLTKDDVPLPEKTVVQDSSSGILGTNGSSKFNNFKNIAPKGHDCQNLAGSNSKSSDTITTQVKSYNEYLEQEEKRLIEKGLIIRNPSKTYQENSSKDGCAPKPDHLQMILNGNQIVLLTNSVSGIGSQLILPATNSSQANLGQASAFILQGLSNAPPAPVIVQVGGKNVLVHPKAQAPSTILQSQMLSQSVNAVTTTADNTSQPVLVLPVQSGCGKVRLQRIAAAPTSTKFSSKRGGTQKSPAVSSSSVVNVPTSLELVKVKEEPVSDMFETKFDVEHEMEMIQIKCEPDTMEINPSELCSVKIKMEPLDD